MVNGRLYDAETMNETGNYNKPRGKFFWELSKNAEYFPLITDTEQAEAGKCLCGKH
jgi:hypothetical protein